jgi:hypothetical protein
MKITKNLILIVLALGLAVNFLAACSGSPDIGDFPTGRFNSTESQHIAYVFNEDATWIFLYYGEHGAEGTYKVDGNLWIEQGTDECPFPGTYEWSFDGTNLTFKLVGEDACEPRRENTDGRTYILVK